MTADTRRHRKLYTADEWADAEASWSGFSDEWEPWRKLAAESGGIIHAPEGTKWDSWADDDPSQRAILIRAIRETPDLLRWAIKAKGAPSWSKVIALLVRERDVLRADIRREESADEKRRADEPDGLQATRRLGEILSILADSAR